MQGLGAQCPSTFNGTWICLEPTPGRQVGPSGLAGTCPLEVLTDSLVPSANTELNGSEGSDLFTARGWKARVRSSLIW
jgi:hypothetical protein